MQTLVIQRKQVSKSAALKPDKPKQIQQKNVNHVGVPIFLQRLPVHHAESSLIQKQEEESAEQIDSLESEELADEGAILQEKSAPNLIQRKEEPQEISESEKEEEPEHQPKLTIGSPNDEYEKEADQVADKVMRQPESNNSNFPEDEQDEVLQPKLLQAKRIQRQTENDTELPENERPLIQTKSDTTTSRKPSNHLKQVVHSPGVGSPIPLNIRNKVEPVLNADLSHVRVHNDKSANKAAKSIQAKAFTHKNNIWLGAGQSPHDVQLMAHEATHVVQQKQYRPLTTAQIQRSPSNHSEPEPREPKSVVSDQQAEFSYQDDLNFYLNEYYDTKYAWFFRVWMLLFLERPSYFEDVEDYDNFLGWCFERAENEADTEAFYGAYILDEFPEGFPLTWSDIVFNALMLPSGLIGKAKETAQNAKKDYENDADALPGLLVNNGLPVPYSEALNLYSFTLNQAYSNPRYASHVVGKFAQSGMEWAKLSRIANFLNTYERGVYNLVNAIEKGNVTVGHGQFDNMVNDTKPLLNVSVVSGNLLPQIQSATSRFMDSLKAIGVALYFLSVADFVALWNQVKSKFNEKLILAGKIIGGWSKFNKLLKAFKLADKLGYFGAAGAQVWEALKKNLWKVVAFLVVYAVTQAIPVVNVITNVALAIFGGVAAGIAIAKAIYVVRDIFSANSMIAFQRYSARLAQSMVDCGIAILSLVAPGALRAFARRAKGALKSYLKVWNIAKSAGMTRSSLKQLINAAKKYNVIIRVRPANPLSVIFRKLGHSPKPEFLKVKSINKLDTYLGARKSDIGLVGYFKPKLPKDFATIEARSMSLANKIYKRYKQRLKEFKNEKDTIIKHIGKGDIEVKNGVVIDMRAGKAKAKAFTSDNDLYDIRSPGGRPINIDQLPGLFEKLKKAPLSAQHKTHLDWAAKTKKDRSIKAKIIDSHRLGGEAVFEFRPNGTVHRSYHWDPSDFMFSIKRRR